MAKDTIPVAPRIQSYLDTETKYFVVPVPAGLDRELVEAALDQKVNASASADQLQKLLRLALLYDARGAAADFGALLTGEEQGGAAMQRAGTSIRALAWLGDDDARRKAQGAFDGLLDRAALAEDRELLLPPCDALTPGPALEAFQRWLRQGIENLDEILEAARRQKQEAREEQLLRDVVNEFLVGPVALLAAAAEKRAAIAAMPDAAARIAPLAELYLGDIDELNTWAGHRLIQIVRRDESGEASGQAAHAFLTLAERFPAPEGEAAAAPEPDDDAEPDEEAEDRLEQAMLHARALRAAAFFGASLSEEQSVWLAEQDDAGTDLLALRPDWQYPDEP